MFSLILGLFSGESVFTIIRNVLIGIVLTAVIGGGGYFIYKAVTAEKKVQQLQDQVNTVKQVAADLNQQVQDTAASQVVTNATEVQVNKTVATITQKHRAKTKTVIQQAQKIETDTTIAVDDKPAKVAAIYIDALWSDYCEAVNNGNPSCPTPTAPATAST